MDVPDTFAALCLDNACGEFGRAIEAALGDVEGKTKKEIQGKADRVLRKWLDIPQQYRGPVAPQRRDEGEV